MEKFINKLKAWKNYLLTFGYGTGAIVFIWLLIKFIFCKLFGICIM